MGMGSALCGVAYHVFGTTVYIISAIIWVFIFVYVSETLTYPTSGVNGILRMSRRSLLRIANLDMETLCYLVMTYKKPNFRSTSL